MVDYRTLPGGNYDPYNLGECGLPDVQTNEPCIDAAMKSRQEADAACKSLTYLFCSCCAAR